ncbi:KRI1-like family C-terminal-domain-containing protein [Irpex rosettiformis]|uniref:KRI1-like family C-terminal-domain-containing protein n=1 Tax=Irpex rosettiformis TaxID=378272 RepID=A0ACB8U8L4_9APHY|nr:KRI1-like family C-terminal-domain-containing protein [Irpex rosettiformis]
MLDDSDSEEDISHLTINEHYAKAFEYRKEREELAKLKEKYGSDAEEDDGSEEDSEDAESEDEDGEELTPAVDAAILRTLARIKRKDPSIYDQEKGVYDEEIEKTGELKLSSRTRKDKDKPLTIRQHALQSVFNPTSRSPSPEPLTHVKEQEALRSETIAAFHTAIDANDDSDDDDLLIPREKAKDELEREEEEYKEFLKREVGENLDELIRVEVEDEGGIIVKVEEGDTERKKNKKSKSKKVNQNKTEEDHKFLMNYILNRGWIDRSAKRLPTYKEITGSSKGKQRATEDDADTDENETSGEEGEEGLEEDEEFDDLADVFESSYNFRFEEPGADQISRYPRNIASTIRREDTQRKEARQRRKERKEEEKQKKKKEVRRLKSLKMKEIREKLERIGKEGGKNVDEDETLQELDLEGDWDPDAHDAQMHKVYGDDDEGGFDGDLEKPTWDDDIDIDDIAPEASDNLKKKKKKKKSKHQEEKEDGVDLDEMDADANYYDGDEWDGTEEMRKRKLDEYMDELYGLEFNDMVGDMPTRFKYTKVESDAFALSPVDILLATDAELNQYVGLKKLAPYRKGALPWDKNRNARLKELKSSLQERKTALGTGDDISKVMPTKKRKGKKERMRAKAAIEQEETGESYDQASAAVQGESKPPSKKRKVKQEAAKQPEHADSDPGPSKAKRRRHKKPGKTSVDA